MRHISIFSLDNKYDNKYILIIILSPLAGCERWKTKKTISSLLIGGKYTRMLQLMGEKNFLHSPMSVNMDLDSPFMIK